MNPVCISSCVNDTLDTRVPVRATYVNLYKWPESEAEFVRSVRRGGGVPAARVVDSISCRQMYLRSYTFSREDDDRSKPEKVLPSATRTSCLGRVKEKASFRRGSKDESDVSPVRLVAAGICVGVSGCVKLIWLLFVSLTLTPTPVKRRLLFYRKRQKYQRLFSVDALTQRLDADADAAAALMKRTKNFKKIVADADAGSCVNQTNSTVIVEKTKPRRRREKSRVRRKKREQACSVIFRFFRRLLSCAVTVDVVDPN